MSGWVLNLVGMRDQRSRDLTIVAIVDGGADLSHRPVPVAADAARHSALRRPEAELRPWQCDQMLE